MCCDLLLEMLRKFLLVKIINENVFLISPTMCYFLYAVGNILILLDQSTKKHNLPKYSIGQSYKVRKQLYLLMKCRLGILGIFSGVHDSFSF